ncbi:hypothetical protein FRC09_016308 [Ceratobasidium sp. 395]|nr:hypothetical protein FRC09_016308 [Ceratobasidium sp. 395]
MERSTHTLMAAANMKQTEVAVRDLKTLIGLSSLVSRDDLSESFEVFTRDARNTGRSLQKFGGRVGMAVDETIVTNKYAIKSLEAAEKGWNRRKDITTTWYRMTGQTKSTIQKLISEASANLRALDILKNELDVIHTMLATEDHQTESDKEEMLSRVWTKLGGNKAKLAHFGSHGQLLKDLFAYRQAAMDHVVGALTHLEQIDGQLEDLNDQIAVPMLQKEAFEIPLEQHIKVMQEGTTRLMEARVREREREDQYMRKLLGDESP